MKIVLLIGDVDAEKIREQLRASRSVAQISIAKPTLFVGILFCPRWTMAFPCAAPGVSIPLPSAVKVMPDASVPASDATVPVIPFVSEPFSKLQRWTGITGARSASVPASTFVSPS